jgi:integrase/recombinase XerD
MTPPRAGKVAVETRIDPHETEERIVTATLKIRTETIRFSREAGKAILEFVKDRETEVSRQRTLTYLRTLPLAATKLGDEFLSPTRGTPGHLKDALSGMKGWTIVSYWACCSKFWKWQYDQAGKDFPSYLHLRIARRFCARKDESIIITPDEVARIAAATITTRDAAFVRVLYESGARAGELLSLRLRDVTRSEHGGFLLHVDGKTGKRTIPLFEGAVPALSAWLKDHPNTTDPAGPLWCGLQATERLGAPIGYAAMAKVVRLAARRAGITKKVNPHLFRHSRATMVAQNPAISGAILEKFFGWQHGSPMAATYLHVSGREVEDAMARGLGVQAIETSKPSSAIPRTCGRCENVNDATSAFCGRCAAPLDLAAVEQLKRDDVDARALLALLKRPEAVTLLRELALSPSPT